MFPFDIEDDEVDVVEVEEKERADYEIDFATGCLTGRIITGLDATVQRATLVLNTDRYFYAQYSWFHGHELSTLIGQHYDAAYTKCEVQRMLEEALMEDPDVLGVLNLDCHMEKDTLTGSFILDTIYGRREMYV